ncbi:Pycsar system effector family protein [Modestobacter excelsi]|uniref:Pycsar system effector family protein n=1 Tax=Modestobacter excelsi TaxID=2213161 RepID=UPI00110CFE29|nr:Pycsar system effector family protein [Modestobacter excelsi]
MTLEAEEHAWRIHAAIQEWIKHAETKASFLLTIQSALMVFFSSRLAANDFSLIDRLTDAALSPLAFILYALGLLCVLGAIGSLIFVVVPRLRSKELAAERGSNAIYFGHVVGQDANDVKRLIEGPTMLDQLSRQISVTGGIAWTKHIWLQTSIFMAVVGVVLIGVAFMMAAFVEV